MTNCQCAPGRVTPDHVAAFIGTPPEALNALEAEPLPAGHYSEDEGDEGEWNP